MADHLLEDDARTLERAEEMLAQGGTLEAIEILTAANRRQSSATLERALVRARYEGCASLPAPTAPVGWVPVLSDGGAGGLVEVAAADLTAEVVRAGFAQSGCVLVRGLVSPERVAPLVAGIDASFEAFDVYDASEAGAEPVDDWFEPFPMPDTISPANAGAAVVTAPGAPPARRLPARPHRRVTRAGAGLWTVDSPHVLFELFELFEDTGVGAVITDYLGERPFLSANKCVLRRVPAAETIGGWHQDGAFLGEDVRSLNCWISLSECGREAPGLDLVPRRFDRLLESGSEEAIFRWSLSDDDVAAAAGPVQPVRPDFAPGDALLFDHRLVHRTATSAAMTKVRHAIEAWFFAPSAFPPSQLPIVY